MPQRRKVSIAAATPAAKAVAMLAIGLSATERRIASLLSAAAFFAVSTESFRR